MTSIHETGQRIVRSAPIERGPTLIERLRGRAWIGVLAGDIGLLAWALMAAVAPQLLMGPAGKTILPAGYEGFTGASWDVLVAQAPKTAEYTGILFRMFGLYGVAYSLTAIAVAATAFRRGERWAWWILLVGNAITYIGAMTYDQIVRAVGPFEASEYLGLFVIAAALAVTARRPSTADREA